MIQIDKTLCTGCGKCVKNCVGSNLLLEEGKAKVAGRCIVCGHCVAICPTAAVSIPEYDMADVKDYTAEEVHLDPIKLLNAIKFRRSIRDYKPLKIEEEKINLILQAGRYTATGKNAQGCRFILVQNEMDKFKEIIWSGLQKAFSLPEEERPVWTKAYRWIYKDASQHKESNFIFQNAPAALLIATDRLGEAGLAAQNIELEAISLGLGILYDEYLCKAADLIPEAREWLEVGDKSLEIAMLIGYPAVKFIRNAPRKPCDFILK